MKINLDRAIVSLICIFPITVIIQIYINIPNRILFSLLFAMLIVAFFMNVTRTYNSVEKLKALITVLLIAVLVIYDYHLTGETLINFNDVMYLPFWVIFLNYVTLKYKTYTNILKSKKKLLKISIIISNFLIVFFYVMDRGFFFNGRHRMASGAFLLAVEVYYYIKETKDKRYWLAMLLPCIAILNSTSRTYLIMLAIFLMIAYYNQIKYKEKFYLTIIPLIIIGTLIVMHSGMMKYFQPEQVGNFDVIGSFTSGRTVFWAMDLEAFKNASIFRKIVGHGYNLVYYINKRAIDAYIYAHNDFLNVLLANGILGLFIYLQTFVRFVIRTVKRQNINFRVLILVIIIFMFNAFFNGQYNYPAATLSMIFVFSALGRKGEKN